MPYGSIACFTTKPAQQDIGAGVSAAGPQAGLLHGVVGLAQRPEYRVGHRPQPLALLLKRSVSQPCSSIGHTPHARRVIAVDPPEGPDDRRNHEGKDSRSVPGAFKALQLLAASVHDAEIPEVTHYLVHLRASQINGCSVCVDIHSRELEHAGEPSARIFAVSAWREAPYFNDAERAALALTEAATRLADHPDPVLDEIWDEAARHYSEPQLAALVISIATINAWNRLNAATRQIGGDWAEQVIQPASQPSRRAELLGSGRLAADSGDIGRRCACDSDGPEGFGG